MEMLGAVGTLVFEAGVVVIVVLAIVAVVGVIGRMLWRD
jgi:hypothetical protein